MSGTLTSEQKKEDWMNSKWRPMMGWMYMLVCVMDFVIFPILWSLVQVIGGGRVETQWSPITLQGAGLFHMAMGAILGIAAYGRTQEKLGGVSNISTSVTAPTSSSGTGNAISTPTNTFGNGPTFTGNTTVLTSPPSYFNTGSTLATTSSKTVVPQAAQPEI
jgi:hypothetical protein